MAYDEDLAERVRTALASGRSTVREVRMFGGLAFMVDERMVVCATSDGDLLVRVDPGRSDELLARPGARPAEMGAGRSMGEGWIAVARDGLMADHDFAFWIAAALDFHSSSRHP